MAGGHTRNNPQAGGVQNQNLNPNIPAGNASIAQQNNAVAVNVLASSALDNVIPVIKEPKEADILAKFKYRQLDKIDGEPNYPKLVELRQQMARNARAVKSLFWGGRTDTKVSSCGTQPTCSARACRGTFTAGTTNDEKKVAITEFILSEQDIPKSEACNKLLKNSFLMQ